MRQPPSLRLSALHMVCQIYNVERFVLSANTTYEEYRFAVTSNRVRAGNLLPSEYPLVRIWFRCDSARFESKFHEECSGAGSWWGSCMSHIFPSRIAAIEVLLNDKELLWCQHCGRGLFFPNCCTLPEHESFTSFSHPFRRSTMNDSIPHRSLGQAQRF
jgi:hypothetical protein